MVEQGFLPRACAVACVTLAAVSALVQVIVAVAGITAGFHFRPVDVSACMACITGGVAMRAGEFVLGVSVMIEFDVDPLFR